jgi:S1-C subfamily serine protease
VPGLQHAELGDSDELVVGQAAYAIGSPYGLENSFSVGHISGFRDFGRFYDGTIPAKFIQTDAAINPGNSGGPLLNSDGEIVGINSAIISPSGGSVGIGFAIPVNTAKRVVPELLAKGYVSHPWLGATIQDLLPEIAKYLKVKVERGALIAVVEKGGPADKAGLRGGSRAVQVGNLEFVVGGDIVVKVDQHEVKNSSEFIRYIREKKPGDTLTLRVLRKGNFEEVKVVLGERPKAKLRRR